MIVGLRIWLKAVFGRFLYILETGMRETVTIRRKTDFTFTDQLSRAPPENEDKHPEHYGFLLQDCGVENDHGVGGEGGPGSAVQSGLRELEPGVPQRRDGGRQGDDGLQHPGGRHDRVGAQDRHWLQPGQIESGVWVDRVSTIVYII